MQRVGAWRGGATPCRRALALAAPAVAPQHPQRRGIGSQCKITCAFATISTVCSSISSMRQQQQQRCLAAAPAGADVGAASEHEAPTSSDLLIVGAGVLGACAGYVWKDTFPDALVTGLTTGTTNHNRLMTLGIVPTTKDDPLPGQSPNVLFCVPPSGSEKYPSEVEAALENWDRSGSFVFTSSSGVFATPSEGTVNEASPTVQMGAGPGTDKLLKAEEVVLQAGGNVLRLAGLYHRNRGAHSFFFKRKEVPRWGGSIINLIHYEDAARLAVSILTSGPRFRGEIFVGCDSNPIALQEMMDACIESQIFDGQVDFTVSESQGPQKIIDNSKTCKNVGWKPKYSSFKSFVDSGAKDFYFRREFF